MRHLTLACVIVLLAACGPMPVAETPDGSVIEEPTPYPNRDEPEVDAGGDEEDAGETLLDSGVEDAGLEQDAGFDEDAGIEHDAGADEDAGLQQDAGTTDAGAPDAGLRDAGIPDAGWTATTSLLRPSNPMPCADPAVVSERNQAQVFYVFCTGMGRVWKTSNWVTFSDVRSSVTFDLTGMPANGRTLGSWWAPGVIWAPALNKYVLWVSVPAAAGVNGPDGWTARSMAVFTAPAPIGPWTYQRMAVDATAGQMFIDPFLFLDHDGGRYVYWKQYGTGITSSIMGARVDATWTQVVTTTRMEVMDGYGGPGTWEDNVRENPAVWYDPSDGRHHLLFSGGHWRDDSYATGHAISACGPLCPVTQTGGWHMRDSGDRNILQVVRSPGHADFTNGGPGGAVFLDDTAQDIIYAAAARSRTGVTTRYLMRDRIKWLNKSPYVDTTGHEPLGY
jgi:hypothetical protein